MLRMGWPITSPSIGKWRFISSVSDYLFVSCSFALIFMTRNVSLSHVQPFVNIHSPPQAGVLLPSLPFGIFLNLLLFWNHETPEICCPSLNHRTNLYVLCIDFSVAELEMVKFFDCDIPIYIAGMDLSCQRCDPTEKKKVGRMQFKYRIRFHVENIKWNAFGVDWRGTDSTLVDGIFYRALFRGRRASLSTNLFALILGRDERRYQRYIKRTRCSCPKYKNSFFFIISLSLFTCDESVMLNLKFFFVGFGCIGGWRESERMCVLCLVSTLIFTKSIQRLLCNSKLSLFTRVVFRAVIAFIQILVSFFSSISSTRMKWLVLQTPASPPYLTLFTMAHSNAGQIFAQHNARKWRWKYSYENVYIFCFFSINKTILRELFVTSECVL